MRRGESETFHWRQNKKKKKQNKTKQNKKRHQQQQRKENRKRQNQEYRICLHPLPYQETEILSPGNLF